MKNWEVSVPFDSPRIYIPEDFKIHLKPIDLYVPESVIEALQKENADLKYENNVLEGELKRMRRVMDVAEER